MASDGPPQPAPPGHGPKLNRVEARQGVAHNRVRWILYLSTGFAAAALLVVLLFFWTRSGPMP